MAFLLSVLAILAAVAEAGQNVDYREDVARGVGAWCVPLIFAIVSIVFAAAGLSAARGRGKPGRARAITALGLSGVAVISSVAHLALIARGG